MIWMSLNQFEKDYDFENKKNFFSFFDSIKNKVTESKKEKKLRSKKWENSQTVTQEIYPRQQSNDKLANISQIQPINENLVFTKSLIRAKFKQNSKIQSTYFEMLSEGWQNDWFFGNCLINSRSLSNVPSG